MSYSSNSTNAYISRLEQAYGFISGYGETYLISDPKQCEELIKLSQDADKPIIVMPDGDHLQIIVVLKLKFFL